MNVLFFFLFLASLGCLIAGLIKPSIFNKVFKKALNRKDVLKFFGIGSVLLFIIIVITTPNKESVNNKVEDQNQQNQNIPTNTVEEVKNENIGKIIKLNSCELDSENADYWQTKEVNFWKTTAKNSIAFKLPACDNLELEIIDYSNEGGNELFKVKYGDQEGWASKIQLMK